MIVGVMMPKELFGTAAKKKTRKLYNQFRILEIVPNDVASRNAGISFSLSIEV
jgi:hypothetical protein